MARVKQPTARLSARTIILLMLGGIGLLSVLLVIGSLIAWRQYNVYQIQTELARIRQAGEPTTAEELAAYYPATLEATVLAEAWLAAVEPLGDPAFDTVTCEFSEAETAQGGPPVPGKPWPLRSKAELLLQQYASSLEQLHAAAQRGGVAHYPVELHKGFTADNPHLQALRRGARLLQVEAHIRAYEGDPAATARAIHAIFMLAHSLDNEPSVMAQFIQIALRGIGHSLLEQLLPVVPFSSEDLNRLRDDVRFQDCETRLYRTMVGERAAGICFIENPFKVSDSENANASPLAAMLPLSSDKAFYLRLMGKLVAAAQQPWPQAIKQADQVDKAFSSARDGPGQIRYLFTSLLLPGDTIIFESTGRGIAQRNIAETIIAVELYYRDHDRLPSQWADLVPKYLSKTPQDPFSGQPLRYVLQDDYYLVYSVGRNGVDDGGNVKLRENEGGEPPDLGVKMPRDRNAPGK